MLRAASRALLPAIVLVLVAACAREAPRPGTTAAPPNVILFVGEGFGPGAWAIGRAFAAAHGERLVLDGAEHLGFLEPRSADRSVTDPAAAATGWATGRLAKNGAIGEIGEGGKSPPPNLFERLADAGRPRGLITTARVTSAIPAPFYARTAVRDDAAAIAAQLIAAMPTLAIGGGRLEFLPDSAAGVRSDGRDLLQEARARGVTVLDSLVAPLPHDHKVLLLLAPSQLPHEIDRKGGPELASLVVAAIRRLSADGPGWFLLVDEGRIDQAARDHDGPALARDVIRLDRAVRAALREVDLKRTLVVAAADRATGNPNLGEGARPDSLDVVSQSVEEMGKRLFDGKPWRGTPAALQAKALPILVEGARHAGLGAGDVDRLLSAPTQEDRDAALGTAISRRFGVVFLAYDDQLSSKSGHGPTGEPVAVRAWGVRSSEVHGVHDHAEFGRWLADVLRLPVAPARSPSK
ncbi:MAG: alkaline phosphatase [bacterium]